MDFQDNLKKLRTDRHISQAKLAEYLDVSPGLVGMYETGKRKPSYEMLEAIADFFNVDIDYLTGREETSTYILKPEDAEVVQILSQAAKSKQLINAIKDLNSEQIDKVLTFIELIK